MQWEYRVIEMNLTEQFGANIEPFQLHEQGLNRLGSEGWELVAVQPLPPGGFSAVTIFKRPLPAEPPRSGPRPLKSTGE